jgi:hypothetical protein
MKIPYDPEVGPYSKADDIRAEIVRVETWPECEDKQDALKMLRDWLALAEKRDAER